MVYTGDLNRIVSDKIKTMPVIEQYQKISKDGHTITLTVASKRQSLFGEDKYYSFSHADGFLYWTKDVSLAKEVYDKIQNLNLKLLRCAVAF